MDPGSHPDVKETTIASHTLKSQNQVAAGTFSTGEAIAVGNETMTTAPPTATAAQTAENQSQSLPSANAHAPTSSSPAGTAQDARSNNGKKSHEEKSDAAVSHSSSQITAEAEDIGRLPANTITEEAETDSKEAKNQPADPRSETDSERTHSKPPQTPSSLDASSATMLREDDFITSPHGNNAIVERSPGGRYVRFMEKLGSGASKEVYRAYDTQEGIEVAWNVVHLAGVPRNERNRIVNEVQLLERLHHHNIISFHGSWVNRAEQQVNFVTEILSSGTLKSFITKVQVIRWKIAKRWAIQILKGLEYLHSQDPPVIHRDLKCENIFINGTSGDLRIGDLGLSTVHRNGKQLSVLGTPEFMAPDMYEENPYDEKVDVYSFGMCMLEIFTKEIPYRECSNPAQIYKRVSRGDPPDSLKRIQSTHARDFIKLCLGRLDENGKYIRPSANELLEHPFLQKRPSDDDEVEVYPVMQERSITESNSTSSPSTKAAARDRSSPASSSSHVNEAVHGASSSSRQRQHSRSNSLNDDESDRFDEMPDSEVNIRKVKVMAGRNLELKEDDDHVSEKAPEKETVVDSAGQNGPTETAAVNPTPTPARPPLASTPPVQPTKHYLVAAAVIENDSNAQPYEDDILKLVVTLPVEGLTQNVQFDFHLVQDDAIQVAKEMVAELGIPQGAVLEISETISGLARAARVSQDKYLARQKAQGHLRSTSQIPSVSSLPAMSSASDMSQNLVQHTPQVTQTQNQSMVPSTSHQSISEFRTEQQQQSVVANHPQTSHLQQSLQQPGLQVHEQSVTMGHAQHAAMSSIPPVQQQQQQQHVHIQPAEVQKSEMTAQQPFGQQPISVSTQQTPPHMNQQLEGYNMNHHVGVATALAHPSTETKSQQSGFTHSVPAPAQIGVRQSSGISSQPDNVATMTYPKSQQVQIPSQPVPPISGHLVAGNHPVQLQNAPNPPLQSSVTPVPPGQSSHGLPQGNQGQGYANGVAPQMQTQSVPQHSQHVPVPTQTVPSLQQHAVSVQQAQAAPSSQRIVSAAGNSGSVEATPSSVTPPVPVPTTDGLSTGPSATMGVPLNQQMNGIHPMPAVPSLNTTSESDHIDDELAVELRKLDEEYKKTVSRAKKVFDSRMDNMARLQHQREAQHQKTLSEHEKQRAEFEKRLQQEEIEQNRRIGQLQKEWERKRQEMKRIQSDSSNPLDQPVSNHDAMNHNPTSSAAESSNEER